MNDQVRFIVDKLNREPFKKNLTFLSFDALQGNNLLQLLNDVFTEIDPKQKIDIKNEEPDQTAIRMLNLLRVLKYKPPDENATNFRNGIVTGDKVMVYPILYWCLEKVPELKKRAYLSNYLVKMNIPGEYMGDAQIIDLYSQYETLIDQFKETHKQYDTLTLSRHTTEDLRRDIENMENEKEQIAKRLDRLKKKVERLNNTNSMLELSHSYRKETERERKIMQQKADLHNLNKQLDQKIDRLERTLKEQQNAFHDVNPESIIQKLEEENKVNSYMVNHKYPKELSLFKQKLKDYESILSKSAMTQTDLNDIKRKIEDVNQEVRQLVERRDLSGDNNDDKLIMFRKQATIIASKKDALAETLNELRSDHATFEKKLRERRQAKGLGDLEGEMLRGEDFKRYVNKLRSKGTTYKMKRQELTELQAEYTTLKRTEEIIRKKFDAVKGNLSPEELQAIDHGFEGKKGKHDGEDIMSKKELKEKISKKKAELAPYVKELKALREICEEISAEYEMKKAKYDQINAGFESNRSALEQDVRILSNEYRMAEERYHKLNSQKLFSLALQKRAQDEIKLITSKSTNEKSFREQLNKRINELETLTKNLKEKQKTIKDVSVDGTKQMKLWKDLLRQMEMKRKIAMGLPLDDMSAYNNASVDYQEN